MSDTTEPCGGCGEADPMKRCVGCMHDFRAQTKAREDAQPVCPTCKGTGALWGGATGHMICEKCGGSSNNPAPDALRVAV